MPEPLVRVEGARRLRSTLRRAGADMTDLKAAHRRVGGIVTTRATATAPRRSGALAQSLRPGAAAANVTVRAGSARVPYAGPIHWGWPDRNISPQPFLTEAAQETEPTWFGVLAEELDRILGKIKGA